MPKSVIVNKTKSTENQTKNLYLKSIVDMGIIALISLVVLYFYETYWFSVHTAKENLLAIHFDMFGMVYSLITLLFMFILPKTVEIFGGRRIIYRYTSEKQIPTKLVRALKIILFSVFIVLFSITFTDKNSRIEIYNNGNIIEYNKNNEIINEYEMSDIDSVEIRTNHDFGRHIDYWTEAVIDIGDSYFILKADDYIVPDEYVADTEECSLYGLKKIKEIFSDKIKINTENLGTLFEVEQYYYTKGQAKELCEIFEVDYDEMMQWLEEEWGIVLEDD